MKEILLELGLSQEESISEYAPRVRDRDDIKVMKCQNSGVIFLARSDHMELTHYRDKGDHRLITTERSIVSPSMLDDARRRHECFGSLIVGKKWLDVGCGDGLLFDEMAGSPSSATGVEPNSLQRTSASERGHTVVDGVEKLGNDKFDIITLFHVFEHLTDPIKFLRELKSHLEPGGTLLLEVPHARDFLLETLQCEPFKQFTLWSEHLILHTRESLRRFLQSSDFSDITIRGHQRYPLSNHLYWLKSGKPGGHDIWSQLNSGDLANSYEQMLQSIDQTDTLVAYVNH